MAGFPYSWMQGCKHTTLDGGFRTSIPGSLLKSTSKIRFFSGHIYRKNELLCLFRFGYMEKAFVGISGPRPLHPRIRGSRKGIFVTQPIIEPVIAHPIYSLRVHGNTLCSSNSPSSLKCSKGRNGPFGPAS